MGQSDFRDGFIITTENDTIYGLVDSKTNARNYESCLFIDESEIREFSPTQINGYGFSNDKLYKSGVKEQVFVEVLVLGSISLYRYNETFLAKKDGEILELTSENIEKVVNGRREIKRSNKWKGLLNYLIADCLSKPAEVTSRLDFSEKSITKTIVKYNSCTGSDFIEIKADQPWTKINAGISTSMSISNISMADELVANNDVSKSLKTVIPMGSVTSTLSRASFRGVPPGRKIFIL